MVMEYLTIWKLFWQHVAFRAGREVSPPAVHTPVGMVCSLLKTHKNQHLFKVAFGKAI